MKNLLKIGLILLFILPLLSKAYSNPLHMHKASQHSANDCIDKEVNCAKTVTAAFSPNGDLWRVWVMQKQLYFQISTDKGESFSDPQVIEGINEKISARNENRPKIAFDKFNGVYLSWAMPREKKYTADIRFSYSNNYGKSFSRPITVNDDNLLTGHSFNEMLVSADGDISIVWLDGRHKYQLKKQGKSANGSALYLGKANYRKGNKAFSNFQLANNTCVCCRIAIDTNSKGELAVFWRHIYGDNIREFALLTVNDEVEESKVIQVSQDHWKINGCPHQGGGISIAEDNRYHLVWFNMGDKGKGIFYAHSSDQGNSFSTKFSIGDIKQQAAHPHIINNGNIVDIVWTLFNGVKHQLMHQRSVDSGLNFGPVKAIASANFGADRPFLIKSGKKNYVSWQRPKQGHWISAL